MNTIETIILLAVVICPLLIGLLIIAMFWLRKSSENFPTSYPYIMDINKNLKENCPVCHRTKENEKARASEKWCNVCCRGCIVVKSK